MEQDEYYHYDLRENTKKIVNPDPRARTNRMFTSPEDWKNIPYYPTLKERQERNQLPHFTNSLKKVSAQQEQNPPQFVPKPMPPRETLLPPHLVPPPRPHPYSPEYAKYMNVKPRATKSANIDMGGVRSKR